MYHGSDKIDGLVSENNYKQSSAFLLLQELYKKSYIEILDLGCSEGKSFEFFKSLNGNINWTGLEVDNPTVFDEFQTKEIKDRGIKIYDGVNIPFEENHFDLVFSRQVMEHVHKPYELIKEVSRVLKADGIFIGSTSNLEAFHSLSTFNYTPYGFTLLFENLPLKLTDLRPGIDFLTLWCSRLSNRSVLLNKFIERYFENQSPVNSMIEFTMKTLKKSGKDISLVKLLFGGHFCFAARKQAGN